MRPMQIVLVAIVVVLIILGLYVIFAKPTVVLPTVSIPVAGAAVIKNIADSQNADGLDLRVRTDGKITAEVAGKELAQVGYTPATLGNTVALAEKVAVPPSTSATLRIAPALIPGLRTLLLNAALSAYYVLPVEIRLKLTPG